MLKEIRNTLRLPPPALGLVDWEYCRVCSRNSYKQVKCKKKQKKLSRHDRLTSELTTLAVEVALLCIEVTK